MKPSLVGLDAEIYETKDLIEHLLKVIRADETLIDVRQRAVFAAQEALDDAKQSAATSRSVLHVQKEKLAYLYRDVYETRK